MPLFRHNTDFARLTDNAIAAWAAIPPAIASDCMNRGQAMAARIKPLAAGTRLTGQARTVACMVGDNSAIHAATRLIGPGDVLVIAAGDYADAALCAISPRFAKPDSPALPPLPFPPDRIRVLAALSTGWLLALVARSRRAI